MTIQQLGQYLWDLGFILTFFHSAPMTALSSFFQTLGLSLEGGQASFTIKVGNAVQLGQDLAGLGVVFSLFKFLQPAAAFVEALGAGLAAGVGSFGPIRVGNDGITVSVAAAGGGADELTFTLAAWPG